MRPSLESTTTAMLLSSLRLLHTAISPSTSLHISPGELSTTNVKDVKDGEEWQCVRMAVIHGNSDISPRGVLMTAIKKETSGSHHLWDIYLNHCFTCTAIYTVP